MAFDINDADKLHQLSYTRGTVLPCTLTLQGSDANTLDCFSTPSAVMVNLHRRVRFFSKSLGGSHTGAAWNETSDDLGTAVWWPSAGIRSNATVRHLEGEIKLAKDLRPTTTVGHFSISVSISYSSCLILFLTSINPVSRCTTSF